MINNYTKISIFCVFYKHVVFILEFYLEIKNKLLNQQSFD